MIIRIWNRLFFNIYSIVFFYRLLLLVYFNPFKWIKNYRIIKYSCNNFNRLRQIMEDDYKSGRIVSIVILLSKILIIWITYLFIWMMLNVISQYIIFLSEISLISKITWMFLLSYCVNYILIFKSGRYLRFFKEFNVSVSNIEIFLCFIGFITLLIGWGVSFLCVK